MRFAIAIALNIVIVVIEIVFGYRADSVGLLSDAFHNISDVAALFVAFAAFRYSARKPTEKMTYGYVRAEMMGGFVNSIFLLRRWVTWSTNRSRRSFILNRSRVWR
jgi:cobalt-zinc-cadmium efflux system protein